MYTFGEAVVNVTRCLDVGVAKQRFFDYLRMVGQEGGSQQFGNLQDAETQVAYANRIQSEMEAGPAARLRCANSTGVW